VSPKATSLKELINDSVRLVEGQADDKQVNVRILNSAKVNEAIIDLDRVNQVLLNLYLNAIESMEAGGELGVELSHSEDSHIEIKISDTGCGIRKEDLSRIFDPYFTTKSSGTGLGLAIAHNIMDAMGGKIDVLSRPDHGTTFSISLPISANF